MAADAQGERELVDASDSDAERDSRCGLAAGVIAGHHAAKEKVPRFMGDPLEDDVPHGEQLPDGEPAVVGGGRVAERVRHGHEKRGGEERQRDGGGEDGEVPEVDEQGAAGAVAVAATEARRGRRQQVQGQVQRHDEGEGQVLEQEAQGADEADGAAAVAGAQPLEQEQGPGAAGLADHPHDEGARVPARARVAEEAREEPHEDRQGLVDGRHARVDAAEGLRRPAQHGCLAGC